MAAPALPRGWTKHVRSCLLRAISLAAAALAVARGKTAALGLRVEFERAQGEHALVQLTEPRPGWPSDARCTSPQAERSGAFRFRD